MHVKAARVVPLSDRALEGALLTIFHLADAGICSSVAIGSGGAGLGSGFVLSLMLPGLVCVAGLSELVHGVEGLHQPRVEIDAQDGRGIDVFRLRKTRMAEDVAHQVLAGLQLFVARRGDALYFSQFSIVTSGFCILAPPRALHALCD